MRIGPLGIWELLIIFVVVLVIFGPSRLPQMAKGVGQAVREFRKGVKDMKSEFAGEDEEEPGRDVHDPARAVSASASAPPKPSPEPQ